MNRGGAGILTKNPCPSAPSQPASGTGSTGFPAGASRELRRDPGQVPDGQARRRKRQCQLELRARKMVHKASSEYCKKFQVSRPVWRDLSGEDRTQSGQAVPAPEKIPHLGPHKYLIWLTLVRCGAADLAVRHRRRAADVPHLCRLAAGRSGDRAVKLHMEIG